MVDLSIIFGTALATLGRSRALLAGYVQALQVRYQGAPKARRNYVEMVGLQKLLGLSASLVAIGANPLDFFLAASPSSHHPHRPPGSGQFMGSFPPNVFLFTGHFFPENVFRPSTDPPLNQPKTSDTNGEVSTSLVSTSLVPQTHPGVRLSKRLLSMYVNQTVRLRRHT